MSHFSSRLTMIVRVSVVPGQRPSILKMTTAQVVETSVTINISPIQDYVHLDDHA